MVTKTQKPDRITNPRDIGSEVAEAIYGALRPLDKIAHEMEAKWGIDRLERLVSPEMAARFRGAQAKLDQAIDSHDAQAVIHEANVLIRGWKALDENANGEPIKAAAKIWIWRHPENDNGFAIAEDTASANEARSIHDANIQVYTLDEVCRLLDSKAMELVNMSKKLFPDAIVKKAGKAGATPQRLRRAGVPDDDIPF